jgi:DNA helicase HerA-like ATPase
MSAINWVIIFVLLLSFIVVVLDLLLKRASYRYNLSVKSVLLELTPPSSSAKSPLATEQLFVVLHHLGSSASWLDRLRYRADVFSFEVVSSRHDGIRYLVSLPVSKQLVFEQQVLAYLPGIRIKRVKDYLRNEGDKSSVSVIEFNQAKHFAYPLAAHDSLASNDPIAYITAAMTKLSVGELVALQLVISPIKLRQIRLVRRNLNKQQYPLVYMRASPTLNLIQHVIIVPLWGVRYLVGLMVPKFSSLHSPRQSKELDQPYRQVLFSSIAAKLASPLFRASLRVMVVTSNKVQTERVVASLSAALSTFDVVDYQKLVIGNERRRRLCPSGYDSYSARGLPILLSQGLVLSTAEVASLYHFPYSESNSAENLGRSRSRSLPVGAELKATADRSDFDVILGVNRHNGSQTAIGLTAPERERHIYIVGGTGNGKTTMLEGALIQDIKSGKGVAIIDPHGDLAEDLLGYIPKERIDDVIYFNPSDIDYPIGLNILELPRASSDSGLELEQDFVTEAIISLFRKLFSEDGTGGHRIESMLRHVIRTAFTVEHATIFTLYDLLTDNHFRKEVVSKLDDKRLLQFWQNEFARAGDMQRVKIISGVTNKLARFDSSIVARRVMEQQTSTIDFEDIMNSGKILICNFAKGSIGEDTAELFGTAVLTKLQLAALRRVRLNKDTRVPFYLYVDEFQHFATQSFLQILSEARKYKLFLTIAEQSTAQQAERRFIHTILDNVGTVVCFRVRSASEHLLLPLFQPHLEIGEIASLPSYSYYLKINGVVNHEPMSGETVVVSDIADRDQVIAEKVIKRSRQNYALEYKSIKSAALKVENIKAIDTKKLRKISAEPLEP